MKNTLLINGSRVVFYAPERIESEIPVVLLHGFCEDASVWEPILPFLEGLPVIRIDLPGFGASEPPLLPGMEVYADATCAVLNEWNAKRCVLYGHSMGGYAALAFIQKHPERLAGCSLVHSHPFADRPGQVENRLRGIDLVRSGKKDAYVTQLFPGLFAPAFLEKHPEIVQELIEKGKQIRAEGIIAALQGMMERPNRESALQNAPCPVQIILGDQDAIIPSDSALQAAALPETADIRLIRGIGHMGMFEARGQVGQAMRNFYHFCKSAGIPNKTQTIS